LGAAVYRQKNKEKFEILEHEVLAMSDHLRSLEKQKADLKAQIKELQPQISRHPQPCLPDIDKASHSGVD
jgi:chaperonin cofactor prefoldin